MTDEFAAAELTALGVAATAADELALALNALPATGPDPRRWQAAATALLAAETPFAVHRFVFDRIYAQWNTANGPPPAWTPDPDAIGETNIGRLVHELGLASYAELHRWSVEQRDDFWDKLIRRLGIPFRQPPTAARAGDAECPQWLPGASLNIAESCFQTDPQAIAVVHQQPGEEMQRTTYGELDAFSNQVANSLVQAGFALGDALAVNLPMTLEAVAIYLGVVKAGAAVVSIPGSLSPEEIATRLRIAGAAGAFVLGPGPRDAAGGSPYEQIAAAAPGVRAIVMPVAGGKDAALRADDLGWREFLSDATAFEPVACTPETASNILFSSGTTGDPKAIPWSHTTPVKAAADAYLHHDVRPGDVLAWPTNLGWMMGPWLVYAALVNHAGMALYGGPPTGKAFGRFVEDAGVNMLGLVPSLVQAWRRTRCMEGLDWSRVRAFSSTGECSNADDMLYLMMLAGYKPIIEYCGGTEIGGGYITGTVVQPAAPATFSTPAIGLDFAILDEDEEATGNGEVFLRPPSIGLSNQLLNHDHHAVYFADTPRGPNGELLRRHGDQVEALGGGYYRHHGRTDDTMNLKGVKVSSAEIERILNTVPEVRETAAIAGSPPEGGPSRLIIYAVLPPGASSDPFKLKAAMQASLRLRHGSTFKIHQVVIAEALPRTASNKVMRRLLRDQFQAAES